MMPKAVLIKLNVNIAYYLFVMQAFYLNGGGILKFDKIYCDFGVFLFIGFDV